MGRLPRAHAVGEFSTIRAAASFTKKHTETQGVLDETPVGDVWGVGPAYARLLKGLGQSYRPGYRYKKARVMLNRLVPADELSMRLFGDERFEKSRRVMKVVDEINTRQGRGTHQGTMGNEISAPLQVLHDPPRQSTKGRLRIRKNCYRRFSTVSPNPRAASLSPDQGTYAEPRPSP